MGKTPKVPIVKTASWLKTGLKRCPKCGQTKPATAEHFYRSAKHTWAFWCKPCEAEKKRLKRKTPERFVSPTHRECTACGEVKPVREFHKNARAKSGTSIYCKRCQNAANRASHGAHRVARNAAQARRVNGCPKSRMNYRILGLVRKALDRKVACQRPLSVTKEFWRSVGYTRQELCEHLESLFLPGMGWHNLKEWHIDHVKPVRLFDFKSFDCPEFKMCWGLANLQPLWAADNLRKGGRYEPPGE